MLELAKQLDVDVRGCISSFFTRIQTADQHYVDAFNDEIEAFKNRIRERARIRIEAAIKQVEEEERKSRLGPGGLDPIEVLESLPPDLKECFETQDIAKLQEVISKMNEEDAKYHLKRCVDSGLWVPDAQSKDKGDSSDGKSEKEEAIYSETESKEGKAE